MQIMYMEEIGQDMSCRFAHDVKDVLVEEQGRPDTLQTFGLAVMQIAFAGLTAKTKHKVMMNPAVNGEQDVLFDRHNLIPTRLSFWLNLLVRADARKVADAQFIEEGRLRGRTTVFDQ